MTISSEPTICLQLLIPKTVQPCLPLIRPLALTCLTGVSTAFIARPSIKQLSKRRQCTKDLLPIGPSRNHHAKLRTSNTPIPTCSTSFMVAVKMPEEWMMLLPAITQTTKKALQDSPNVTWIGCVGKSNRNERAPSRNSKSRIGTSCSSCMPLRPPSCSACSFSPMSTKVASSPPLNSSWSFSTCA